MAKTVGAKIADSWIRDLDALALLWSEREGREVSRSEVVRTLLRKGLDTFPVDAETRARASRGEAPRLPARDAGSAPLRVVEGALLAGYDVPRGRGRLNPVGQALLPLRAGAEVSTSQYSRRVTRRAA